jgi:hypothetical protein
MMLRIPGVKDIDVIQNLQFTILNLQMQLPFRGQPKFFTHGLITAHYKACFPEHGVPKWYVRLFLKQPYFRLDDVTGWRNNILLKGTNNEGEISYAKRS